MEGQCITFNQHIFIYNFMKYSMFSQARPLQYILKGTVHHGYTPELIVLQPCISEMYTLKNAGLF